VRWGGARARRLAGALGAAILTLIAAASSATPLTVVATTSDVASLSAAVGGDLVSVEVIVPPGSDPETFEPRPRDLLTLRRADLLVRVGLGYDDWIEKLVAQLGRRELARGGEASVDASQGVPLLEVRGGGPVSQDGHAHGVANPHYWLDPVNAETMTAAIGEGIVRREPTARDAVTANRDRFLAELHQRLEDWSRALAPYQGGAVIAYHNSWPYFARRFHLNIVGLIEAKEGVAPSPAHLVELEALARESRVAVIVHDAYEPSDASRFLARRSGAALVVLAPSVGSLVEASDYLALFDHDVAALVTAFATHRP
jgi:ABC-type Zn uptake system ZnuABC Zn-binding protein ZnuA